MSFFGKLRRYALSALLLACLTAVLHAQRGGGGGRGGPGGGGPGGPPGGGFGGPASGGSPRGEAYGGHGFGNGGNYDSSVQRRGPQLAPPGRWWNDKKTAKSLSLRPDQQHRMDDILAANKGTLLNLYSNWKHEEDRLTSMSREDLQDESKVFAGIDRVAQARTDLEKANAHMLLQLRKELDSQQLAELDKEVAAVH